MSGSATGTAFVEVVLEDVEAVVAEADDVATAWVVVFDVWVEVFAACDVVFSVLEDEVFEVSADDVFADEEADVFEELSAAEAVDEAVFVSAGAVWAVEPVWAGCTEYADAELEEGVMFRLSVTAVWDMPDAVA